MRWRQRFLVPAKRVGGDSKEIVREFIAPTLKDAVTWAKAQADRAGWVLLGRPHGFHPPKAPPAPMKCSKHNWQPDLAPFYRCSRCGRYGVRRTHGPNRGLVTVTRDKPREPQDGPTCGAGASLGNRRVAPKAGQP